MDISECSLIGWEIGWEISRFGAYLSAYILLIHSEMCRYWKIWQIFSPTRFLYNNLLRTQTAIILRKDFAVWI